MKIKKMFKLYREQGGADLIKGYYRSGVLVYSLVEATMLGMSKTSLEILRLAIQNKQMKHLKKKYHEKIVESYVRNNTVYKNNLKSMQKRPIWFCWLQGID